MHIITGMLSVITVACHSAACKDAYSQNCGTTMMQDLVEAQQISTLTRHTHPRQR